MLEIERVCLVWLCNWRAWIAADAMVMSRHALFRFERNLKNLTNSCLNSEALCTSVIRLFLSALCGILSSTSTLYFVLLRRFEYACTLYVYLFCISPIIMLDWTSLLFFLWCSSICYGILRLLNLLLSTVHGIRVEMQYVELPGWINLMDIH
jgi:hypothetical protein